MTVNSDAKEVSEPPLPSSADSLGVAVAVSEWGIKIHRTLSSNVNQTVFLLFLR
jgi:hypothetical protein